MEAPSRIFLVGPMGAGKTTIGRVLADELGLQFLDVDREIEARSGVDIPWIFDMEGEEGFRDRESAMLEELCSRENVLVSTGGGAVMRLRNRELMACHGLVIYLHTSVEEQVRRTARDRKRPLLREGRPRDVLSSLMTLREPLYRELADVVVDTDGRNPRGVALSIKALLAGRES